MTAIAGLRFQALFGERPFTDADRSLDLKTATDAFGSGLAGHAFDLGASKRSSSLKDWRQTSHQDEFPVRAAARMGQDCPHRPQQLAGSTAEALQHVVKDARNVVVEVINRQ